MIESKRKMLTHLGTQLDNEFSSFTSHYRDLSDYMLPRKLRLTTSETNKGDKKNSKIIDSTATFAAGTLSAGMMAGVTSPARPWFKLSTPDPAMALFAPVKRWLHEVEKLIRDALIKSNIYNNLPITYESIGGFGVGALMLEEDFKDIARSFTYPVGSYRIASNDKLKVDVFKRDFRLTVKQVVEKFGEVDGRTGMPKWDNFSTHVKDLYQKGDYNTWIDVTHFIMPNKNYDPGKSHKLSKKYASTYFETGNSKNSLDDDIFLRESGYDYFPVLCPRWKVTGEDVYGTDCPGMTALGDVKALQLMHKRKAQAIEYSIKPPMTAPESFKGTRTSILPGDVTYGDSREGDRGFRPAYTVNPNIGALVEDIREHQGRIQKAFYEDLFLMLANSDRRQITATEVAERKEEKAFSSWTCT